MQMAGRKRKDGGSKEPYEIARDAKIERNNEYLKKLKIQNLLLIPLPGESLSQCEKNNGKTSIANHDENPEYEVDSEAMDDDSHDDDLDNEEGYHYEPVEETHVAQLTQSLRKKKVRGPTKMKSITRTQGKVKMFVKINRLGQPCGIRTCNFTNFISYLVKGGDISFQKTDWRKAEHKKKIWTTMNKYFTIDPICEEWVKKSTGKKWRDFKNTLKTKYFDENLTQEENIASGCNNRISMPDWEWLVKYWCKKETKARSQQNAQVHRNQLNALHTCGSRSYAVVSHKLDVIRERIESDHNLALKTIEDGDLYADIFPKEQKGRIRGLGLLPSGSKSLALARATAAMRKMDEENAQLKARMETSERNYNELKSMVLAMQGVGSLVGSINAHNGSPLGASDGGGYLGAGNGAGGVVGAGNGAGGAVGTSNGVGGAIGASNRAGATVDAGNGAGGAVVAEVGQFVGVEKRLAGATKKKAKPTVKQNIQEMAKSKGQHLPSLSSNNVVHVDQLNQTRNLGQKVQTSDHKVALRSPSSSNIVAYGRLGRIDKNAKAMDGMPLGGFYEVHVDVVLDKLFVLPRAQGTVSKLGGAVGRCIAWPFQNVVQEDGSPLNISMRATD